MQSPAPKSGEAPQHGTPAGATPPEAAQEHPGHPPALPGPPSTIPALQHAGPPRSGPPAQHHMQGSRPHSPRGRGSGPRGGRWDGHRGRGPQGWGGGGSDWDYRGHRGGHRGGGERGHMPLQPPPGPPILPQQQWGPQGYPAAAGQYQGYPPGPGYRGGPPPQQQWPGPMPPAGDPPGYRSAQQAYPPAAYQGQQHPGAAAYPYGHDYYAQQGYGQWPDAAAAQAWEHYNQQQQQQQLLQQQQQQQLRPPQPPEEAMSQGADLLAAGGAAAAAADGSAAAPPPPPPPEPGSTGPAGGSGAAAEGGMAAAARADAAGPLTAGLSPGPARASPIAPAAAPPAGAGAGRQQAATEGGLLKPPVAVGGVVAPFKLTVPAGKSRTPTISPLQFGGKPAAAAKLKPLPAALSLQATPPSVAAAFSTANSVEEGELPEVAPASTGAAGEGAAAAAGGVPAVVLATQLLASAPLAPPVVVVVDGAPGDAALSQSAPTVHAGQRPPGKTAVDMAQQLAVYKAEAMTKAAAVLEAQAAAARAAAAAALTTATNPPAMTPPAFGSSTAPLVFQGAVKAAAIAAMPGAVTAVASVPAQAATTPPQDAHFAEAVAAAAAAAAQAASLKPAAQEGQHRVSEGGGGGGRGRHRSPSSSSFSRGRGNSIYSTSSSSRRSRSRSDSHARSRSPRRKGRHSRSRSPSSRHQSQTLLPEHYRTNNWRHRHGSRSPSMRRSRSGSRHHSRSRSRSRSRDRRRQDSRDHRRHDSRHHENGHHADHRAHGHQPHGRTFHDRPDDRPHGRPMTGPHDRHFWRPDGRVYGPPHGGPPHGPRPHNMPPHDRQYRHGDERSRDWERDRRPDDRERYRERDRRPSEDRGHSRGPADSGHRHDQQQQQQHDQPEKGPVGNARGLGTPRASPLVPPGSVSRASRSPHPQASGAGQPQQQQQQQQQERQQQERQQQERQQQERQQQDRQQQERQQQDRQWTPAHAHQQQQERHWTPTRTQQQLHQQAQHPQQEQQEQQQAQKAKQESPPPPPPPPPEQQQSPPPPPPPPAAQEQQQQQQPQVWPGGQQQQQRQQQQQHVDAISSHALGYVAWANMRVKQQGLPPGGTEWNEYLGMYRDAHGNWQSLKGYNQHPGLVGSLTPQQTAESEQRLPAIAHKLRDNIYHLCQAVSGDPSATLAGDPVTKLQTMLERVTKYYEGLFVLHASDEDAFAAQFQANESDKQRQQVREDFDRTALSLNLRAQPVVLDPAVMQRPRRRDVDPRHHRLTRTPVGAAAAQLNEALPPVGPDGAAWLALPLFALHEDYLGAEVHAAVQQRLHHLATASARAEVLLERPRLLEMARQGRTGAAAEQQQQQQPDECAGVEPLDAGALDLENTESSWELVLLRAGTVQPGSKGVVRGTLAQLRSWAREGLHGVKWGALIVRCSDKLQLLLQEAPYSVADVVWGATDCVYDNMVARGRLEPHLQPGAAEAELRAAKAAAAAAVPDAVVPVLLELGLNERVAASISAVTEAAQSSTKAQLQKRFAAVLPKPNCANSSASNADKSAAVSLAQQLLDSAVSASSSSRTATDIGADAAAAQPAAASAEPAAAAQAAAAAPATAAEPGAGSSAKEQQAHIGQRLLSNTGRLLGLQARQAAWSRQRRAAAAAESARFKARTKALQRDVFGPPVTLESKAAFIAAVVNRAATGQQFKNKVGGLLKESQAEQQLQGAGGLPGPGARLAMSLPRLGVPQQQQQHRLGGPLLGHKRPSPDSNA